MRKSALLGFPKVALLAAAMLAGSAGVVAARPVASPDESAVIKSVAQAQNAGRGREQPAVNTDSAPRDSAAPRARRQAEAADLAQPPSTLRKVGIVLIMLTLAAAIVIAFLIFGRGRNRLDDDIPIVFNPRENIPSTPEFPNVGRFERPVMAPAPPPTTIQHAGNNNNSGGPSPAQGTMQLLPGRFEVMSGLANQKEIRFVKEPGQPTVTFGREGGDQSHIQVDSPTVSRKHASMRYDLGKWHITNLSSTNPVVVNGKQLLPDKEQLLSDGDQVEMGEVVFTFRSR